MDTMSWIISIFFAVIFTWMCNEHIVMKHFDGDWHRFWKDWFLVVSMAIVGTTAARAFIMGLIWLMEFVIHVNQTGRLFGA